MNEKEREKCGRNAKIEIQIQRQKRRFKLSEKLYEYTNGIITFLNLCGISIALMNFDAMTGGN